MIFTEASIYRLFEFKHSLEELNEKLSKHRYSPIGDASTFAGGFINPMDPVLEEQAIQLGHLFGFAYRVEEKKVAPAKVHELTRKRIKELEEKGSAITKQLESDIEDSARKELLRLEVPSVHVVTGFIDAKQNWLYLNTKSGKLCDYALGAMRKMIGSFRLMPARTAKNPSTILSNHLCREGVSLAKGLNVDFEGKLKAVGEKASQKVTFDGIGLYENELAVLDGMDIIEADLYLDKSVGEDDFQRWSFKFHTKKGDQPYQLSKISHIPLSQDDYSGFGNGDQDTYYNADWLLTADLLHSLNQALGDSFGGFNDFEDKEKPEGESVTPDKDGVVWLSEIQKAASKGLPEGVTVTVGEVGQSLYSQAKALVISEQRASVSMLQRAFKIGYNRAAELIEKMEVQGVVTAPSHNGLREVLIKEGE